MCAEVCVCMHMCVGGAVYTDSLTVTPLFQVNLISGFHAQSPFLQSTQLYNGLHNPWMPFHHLSYHTANEACRESQASVLSLPTTIGLFVSTSRGGNCATV